MKYKFLSTFSHVIYPHFPVTSKCRFFHFGVPNENEGKQTERKVNAERTESASESTVSARWMHEKMEK